jgi:hypothetical protein
VRLHAYTDIRWSNAIDSCIYPCYLGENRCKLCLCGGLRGLRLQSISGCKPTWTDWHSLDNSLHRHPARSEGECARVLGTSSSTWRSQLWNLAGLVAAAGVICSRQASSLCSHLTLRVSLCAALRVAASFSLLPTADMAEISLAVNVLQIISTCASTIQKIDHLIRQYKEAPKKLASLLSEAKLANRRLDALQKLFRGTPSFYTKILEDDADLRSAIDQALTGCWTILLVLHKELGKLEPVPGEKFNIVRKLRLLFNDEIIQDYLSQIRGHVSGLDSVLACLQA